MKYAVYPPIGFARVGNSPDQFFVGPEQRDSVGVEIDADGNEQQVNSFKDDQYRMKRQGARFQLFELSDGGAAPVPARLPDGATVEWLVKMVNKKDAVRRPNSPPSSPMRVEVDPSRRDRIISTQAAPTATAPMALDGRYKGVDVSLGSVRVDTLGRLIVLGGRGRSESPSSAPIGGNFYNNPDWFDDVGDGPVRATISIPGRDPIEAEPAWVIVAPPDFAPVSLGVVTLYDLVLQVAIDQSWVQQHEYPFFETDIRPLIERASNLQWVHANSGWPKISREWTRLKNCDATEYSLRMETSKRIVHAESVLQSFELMEWQLDYLDAWVDGNFDPGSRPSPGPAFDLTRSALDGTVGAGLFPGIEAGVNITNPNIFKQPPFEFRFKPNILEAGDMTAHMALPWQADFLKCSIGWWPSQRPNHAPQAAGPEKEWLRPSMEHGELVHEVMKLGVIRESLDGNTFEQERDPRLGD